MSRHRYGKRLSEMTGAELRALAVPKEYRGVGFKMSCNVAFEMLRRKYAIRCNRDDADAWVEGGGCYDSWYIAYTSEDEVGVEFMAALAKSVAKGAA